MEAGGEGTDVEIDEKIISLGQSEITPPSCCNQLFCSGSKQHLTPRPAAEVIAADLDKYKRNSSGHYSESTLVLQQIMPQFI